MMGSWSITDLEVGDRVVHYRDHGLRGVVSVVEENRLSVMVRWDGDDEDDFQWANKVVVCGEGER